ncbi:MULTISPECIES: cytochrome P450 [unclassified Mesorhizobium]|uniref:cytochrome P450 n=1 Tax=unclassified Mesorhizobium TaxID=325217 RepID=UPI00333ACE5E
MGTDSGFSQEGPPVAACPVFDANSALYQNLGLLKVAEEASRRHGDLVVLHTGDDRDTYLLSGEQGLRSWKENAAQLLATFGDVRSNANTTRMLLGADGQGASWARVGLALRRALSQAEAASEAQFDAAADAAADAFIAEVQGTVDDLRDLTRLWAVRSVAPTIFGSVADPATLAQGLIAMQSFHRFVFNKTAETLHSAESSEEFIKIRAFLDQVVAASIEAARPGDPTFVAALAGALPEEIEPDARVNLLRPILFRILKDRLNVDGLGLFWALVHLARDDALAAALAGEQDAGARPDGRSLAMSVAKETARLYPEHPFVYRTAGRSMSVDGMTIPTGATVLFSPWLMHHDQRCWREPSRFYGRRFMAESEDPECFMPFGLSPTARKQTRFMLRQLSRSLHTVTCALEFEIAPACAPGNLRPFLRAQLAPRGPVPFVFRRRRQLVETGWLQ